MDFTAFTYWTLLIGLGEMVVVVGMMKMSVEEKAGSVVVVVTQGGGWMCDGSGTGLPHLSLPEQHNEVGCRTSRETGWKEAADVRERANVYCVNKFFAHVFLISCQSLWIVFCHVLRSNASSLMYIDCLMLIQA